MHGYVSKEHRRPGALGKRRACSAGPATSHRISAPPCPLAASSAGLEVISEASLELTTFQFDLGLDVARALNVPFPLFSPFLLRRGTAVVGARVRDFCCFSVSWFCPKCRRGCSVVVRCASQHSHVFGRSEGSEL